MLDRVLETNTSTITTEECCIYEIDGHIIKIPKYIKELYDSKTEFKLDEEIQRLYMITQLKEELYSNDAEISAMTLYNCLVDIEDAFLGFGHRISQDDIAKLFSECVS